MTVVLDANILLRLVDSASLLHTIAVSAVRDLIAKNAILVTLPQSLYEF